MDELVEPKSLALDLSLQLCANLLDIDKNALLTWLEGRGELSDAVVTKIKQFAAQHSCDGVKYEVMDSPYQTIRLLISLLEELQDSLAMFLSWNTPAGVKVKKDGTCVLVNPFGQQISPVLSSLEAVHRFIRSYCFRQFGD